MMKFIFIFILTTLVFSPNSLRANVDIDIDSFIISPAPEIPPHIAPVDDYFVFSKNFAVNFRWGSAFSLDEQAGVGLFGFMLTNYLENMDSYEYGLDVSTDDIGRLHFGKKYLFNINQRLVRHYKWIFSIDIDSKKGLANFVNAKKYSIGGALGFEYKWLRTDLECFIMVDDVILQLQFAYLISW